LHEKIVHEKYGKTGEKIRTWATKVRRGLEEPFSAISDNVNALYFCHNSRDCF
jgi:hypothetical protein